MTEWLLQILTQLGKKAWLKLNALQCLKFEFSYGEQFAIFYALHTRQLNSVLLLSHIEAYKLFFSSLFYSFKKRANPGLFFFFRSFLVTISLQTEQSIDGVLGIRTRGRRMVGADETTELWQPPKGI